MKSIYLVLFGTFISTLALASEPVENEGKELKCTLYVSKAGPESLPKKTLTGKYYPDTIVDGKVESVGEFGISEESAIGGLIQVRFKNNGESQIGYRPKKDEGRWLTARSEGGILSKLSLDADLTPLNGNGSYIEVICQVQKKN